MHCRTTFLLSTSLTSLEELGRYNVVYGCVLTLTQTLSTYTQWTYPMGGVCVPWELFDQCESSEEDLGFECLYQPTTVARGNPLLVSAPFAYNLSHTHTSTPLLLAIVTISSPPPSLPPPLLPGQVPVVVMKPGQVVQWVWEVVRGEAEFTLLRPTGCVYSVEGGGMEGEQVDGYERLQEAELGRPGEVKQVGAHLLHHLLRLHITCRHLQGSYECVGTELLALHWVASPPIATIMFSYEITGAQQHR